MVKRHTLLAHDSFPDLPAEVVAASDYDALAARLAEAMEGTERLRGLLSRLLGTRNAECRALARLEVAQNNYLDHRQELADYESASLAASACEAEARVAIDAAIAVEQQGAGNE